MKNYYLIKTLHKIESLTYEMEAKPLRVTLGIGSCYSDEMAECIDLLFSAWRYLTSNRQVFLMKKSSAIYRQLIIEYCAGTDMYQPFFELLYVRKKNNQHLCEQLDFQRAWNIALGTSNQDMLRVSPVHIDYQFDLHDEFEKLAAGSLRFNEQFISVNDYERIKSALRMRKLTASHGFYGQRYLKKTKPPRDGWR